MSSWKRTSHGAGVRTPPGSWKRFHFRMPERISDPCSSQTLISYLKGFVQELRLQRVLGGGLRCSLMSFWKITTRETGASLNYVCSRGFLNPRNFESTSILPLGFGQELHFQLLLGIGLGWFPFLWLALPSAMPITW